jgi:hypothetical protein
VSQDEVWTSAVNCQEVMFQLVSACSGGPQDREWVYLMLRQ